MTSAMSFINNTTNAGLVTNTTLGISIGSTLLTSFCIFANMKSTTGANQVVFSMEQVLHTIGWQVLYDNTSGTWAFLTQDGTVHITTITPVLNQWYFLAFVGSAIGAGSSGTTNIKMFVKQVGAPTCRTFSFSSTGTALAYFTSLNECIGNQNVFTGSSNSILPFVGSLCGLKYWDTLLSQEEIERESEQIAPFNTQHMRCFFPLSSNIDLYTSTQYSNGAQILLTAQSPSNLGQVSGPPLPEYRACNDPTNLFIW